MAETRKLAAILAADVVGFQPFDPRGRGSDPGGAQGARSDLIDPTIAIYHGRVVKRTSDDTSVEFLSVVDAVRCAVEVLNGALSRPTGLQ
jgi:adenylate cyclase